MAIGNREKKAKPIPKNFGEISEVIHEISIPTPESLENIRKKHLRQEELKRSTPKKKITHLNLYKKPAINSGINLTVVTEELTN